MPDPSGCPTEQQWADFLAGQVPPAVAASVRTHLDECSRCAQVVHQLQAGCPSRDTGHPPTAAPETPWLPGGDEAVDSDDADPRTRRRWAAWASTTC
jgi:anti-sigma factor ChrR (cupin superfamily)